MTDFMNFFNITDHIQYSSIYHKQNQNQFKKLRRKKSNSNRVFDTKTIANSFFKIFFRITSRSEFDFKKSNKNFKRRKHVYMIDDDEKKSTITNSTTKKTTIKTWIMKKKASHQHFSSKRIFWWKWSLSKSSTISDSIYAKNVKFFSRLIINYTITFETNAKQIESKINFVILSIKTNQNWQISRNLSTIRFLS